MEEGGFKKKFLAPLVVIMLCAVALAGAAYAYTSTVQGNGTIPDPNYYTIDLYTTGEATQTVKDSINAGTNFEAYTTKVVNGNYMGHVDNDGKATELKFTTYVMVNSNLKNDACRIDANVKYTEQTGTTAMYSSWADSENGIKFVTNFYALESTTPTESFVTQQVYRVEITATLPVISDFNLGDDFSQVIDNMKFVGTNCISITLTATKV